MSRPAENSNNAIKRLMVGTRYPEDRIGLLDVVKVRRGFKHRSEVVEEALDKLLEDEGLLEAA